MTNCSLLISTTRIPNYVTLKRFLHYCGAVFLRLACQIVERSKQSLCSLAHLAEQWSYPKNKNCSQPKIVTGLFFERRNFQKRSHSPYLKHQRFSSRVNFHNPFTARPCALFCTLIWRDHFFNFFLCFFYFSILAFKVCKTIYFQKAQDQ